MFQFTLSNHGLMALGICVGYKPHARANAMAQYGVDHCTAFAEFKRVGLIKGVQLDKELARIAFQERFPGIQGSQTHLYAGTLGYKRKYRTI